ncbi:MAG: NUDIX domain-containing protein [Anaerolineae bacterium]
MATLITGDRVGKLGQLAIGCSATVFDETKQKMLLVRRTDNGRWAVPGGYMEPGESVAEACEREVWEETGLSVRVKRLIAVYSDPHKLLEYPDGSRYQLVVLHFLAESANGVLSTSNETSDLGYFTRADIDQMDIGELDQKRIADGFAAQSVTFIC